MRSPLSVGGYVYIMSDKDGLLKVGSTNDLKKRLSNIRCGNPSTKIEFHTCALRNRAEVERVAQKSIKTHRISGEWFDCSLDIARLAIESSVELVGDVMTDGKEYDHDEFESKMEDATCQAVGILSKINFGKYPAIVDLYTDYLYSTNKAYLPIYASKRDSEKFLEAATVLANTYVTDSKLDLSC